MLLCFNNKKIANKTWNKSQKKKKQQKKLPAENYIDKLIYPVRENGHFHLAMCGMCFVSRNFIFFPIQFRDLSFFLDYYSKAKWTQRGAYLVEQIMIFIITQMMMMIGGIFSFLVLFCSNLLWFSFVSV